jgi:hypothetical protein
VGGARAPSFSGVSRVSAGEESCTLTDGVERRVTRALSAG